MPDEKRIERWSIVGMVKSVSQRSDGRYVKWEDHQDALGEAEKDRERARGACVDVERKLESLRSGLSERNEEVQTLADWIATESQDYLREPNEIRRAYWLAYRACLAQAGKILAKVNEETGVVRPLSQLLDASGDTEKQSDLHSRSAIALVAGHLEGYADNLALPYPYNRNQLVEALREDAEKLKQSGGGECS